MRTIGTLPLRPRSPRRLALTVLGALLLLAGGAQAQVMGQVLSYSPGATGYLEVPHHAALNPTSAFTFEAWVQFGSDPSGVDCRSIAGKNYLASWWVGRCKVAGTWLLRSYLKGAGAARQGGVVSGHGEWTHVAVTYDGAARRHYINGELAASFAESGSLAGSTDALRLGSDVAWTPALLGLMEEARLWRVARTEAQIRQHLNVRILTAQPGLVAVWPFEGSGNTAVGGFDGSVHGSGVAFASNGTGLSCGGGGSDFMCLQGRFLVTMDWRTNSVPGTSTDGAAHVVGAGPDSGVFWFFAADNWEVMVKAIDACTFNTRYWIFSAATTNVYYRMQVWDMHGGDIKTYFNYPGPPAPAVTDTDAFASCP